MNGELILIDREALLAELRQAFDPQTAEILLRVLDKVAAQVHRAGVTREDLRELKQAIADLVAIQRHTDEQIAGLAEAQRRTEERVGSLEAAVERLAEAQRRTDEQVAGLAEAQRRTEERVGSLEAAVERLAEAQRRTEERVSSLESSADEMRWAISELIRAVNDLRKQVGGLSETVGGDIEDIAYIVLHEVLKREFGWQVGVLERSWQTWDTEPEEVNIFGMASDPTKPERTIWIVGEAKHNLTINEARRFIGQVERARQRLAGGEVFPVCFCYRARPEVQQMIRNAGIRLVFSYGKLV